MTTYQKVKSVAKNVLPKGKLLNQKILDTMKDISEIVGNTMGPGGQPVLIERSEHDLPAFVTKDGVTVYRSLGFRDPIAHSIMETARDASIRTASEAGDGTTTATVLSEAIVRNTLGFTEKNRRLSPQRVVRVLQQVFSQSLEPLIKSLAIPVDSTSEAGQKLMHKIATTSANGDADLGNAVLEAFDVTGDEGNVTIIEASGPSHYEVERIAGYPVNIGYEDSLGRFYSRFINDDGNQRVVIDDPVFLIYNGKLTEYLDLAQALGVIGQHFITAGFNHNVVLVALGFSEAVLGNLAINWSDTGTLKVLPMIVPLSAQLNGQTGMLEDLAAITGARVFDPMSYPLNKAELGDFGPVFDDTQEGGGLRLRSRGVRHVEMYRFRSMFIGMQEGEEAEQRVAERMDVLAQQREAAGASEFDRLLLQERIAKLTGGIARLKVFGSSNGELKEKRDRAEDAVCAVRGALKHGCLPGGAWTYQYLVEAVLAGKDPEGIATEILVPSLRAPFDRLLSNAGYTADEIDASRKLISDNAKELLASTEESLESAMIVDITKGVLISAIDEGVVDSVPAVLEALRNSLSIASLLGTLGGTVVFERDSDLERTEARATSSFNRMANSDANGADERP